MQAYIVKSLPLPLFLDSSLFLSPEISVGFSETSLAYISKDIHSCTLFLLFCAQMIMSFFLNLVYLGDYWCRNRVSIYLQLWGILLYEWHAYNFLSVIPNLSSETKSFLSLWKTHPVAKYDLDWHEFY